MRRVLASGAGFAILGIVASCVHDGYPLGSAGKVQIIATASDQAPLFATIDPTGARQMPDSANVQLVITDDGAPAFGAYVEVAVIPPEALTLSSATPAADALIGEKNGSTCQFTDGNFRCLASKEGEAEFVATAGKYSGTADIVVTWSSLSQDLKIPVQPAGLPSTVPNLQLIGITANDHILATFAAVKCTTSALPSDLGTAWREGAVRSRQLSIVATPPPGQMGVVESAPVTVQALSGAAALSTDQACGMATRQAVEVVHLDAKGQSIEPLFGCFSDVGGTISFAVSSGQVTVTPNPTILVDPEPRIFRVESTKLTTPVSLSPIDMFDVSCVRRESQSDRGPGRSRD